MRNRRNKRHFNKELIDYLKMISNLLLILILFALLLFIYSSIKVKKSSTIVKDFNYTTNSLSEFDINTTDEQQNTNNNNKNNDENNSVIENMEKNKVKKSSTINMAFTGDIICGNSIYNDAYNSYSNTYDFSYLFDNIKFNIQTADIAIGSLETDFSNSNNKSVSQTNSKENLAYTLKKVGFDVLSTANNHCLDNGYAGLENTINILDRADISHTGTFTSQEAKDTILIKNIKGLKIAFLSFCCNTNEISIPNDKSYSVNLIDEHLVEEQFALAKTEEPDIICVCMHWGTRYQTKQNSDQEKWTNYLFQKGADIIIGTHPHVLQSMEKRTITLQDGTIKEGFVIYSLGNLLADQTQNNTKTSAILNLKITKDYDNKKLTFDSITYTPIYIYKDSSKPSQKFSILNLKNTIASYEAGYDNSIGTKNYSLLKNELENIKKVFGD